MTEKIKILFLAANSSDDNRRRLEQEAREIREKIRRGKYRDSFDLITQFAVRPSDLQETLLEHQPHIVHFSGRGTKNQGIILENDAGQTQTLSEQVLTGLFRTLKDNIRIIVFNACYTNRQAAALAEIVDYAIGINESVESDTAVTFSTSFYQALAFGRTVKEAFDLAVTQLMLEKAEEYQRPVFKTHSDVDISQSFLKLIKQAGRSPTGNHGPLFPQISAALRQRCLELFGLFDELRTPADLRAFATTEKLIWVKKSIPNSSEINYDRLLDSLLRTGRSISEPALFDLLNELADRYRGDFKGEVCESLIEAISKEFA
jgi:hypothetical protein